ncbi:MAG: hypothetical protein ACTSSB_15800 [Candidatus Heimdallarchaeota archaeon]
MISLAEANLKYHYDKQREQKIEYVSQLIYSEGFQLNLPHEIKAVILAAAISHNDSELFSFAKEILHCNILDVRDAIRLLSKQKEIPRLTSKRKVMINEEFFAKLPEETLRFHLLKYSEDAFREVIKLTHPHPDIFQDKTFQKNVFGQKGGVIGEIRDMLKNPTLKDAKELIYDYKLPFHYLRSKLPKSLFAKLIPSLIETEALPVIMRNFGNLVIYNSQIKLLRLLENRISKIDHLQMNLGELSMFISRFEYKLTPGTITKLAKFGDNIIINSSKEINLGDNIAIIGDASASMRYAIEFATMLATIINYRSKNSDLIFFNNTIFRPDKIPTNFTEVQDYVKKNQAYGATAPALVIEEYLKNKTKFDTLLFITDEEETMSGNQYQNIGAASEEYLKFSPNTRFIFLTIGQSKGMTIALDNKGIPYVRLEISSNMDIAMKSIQTLLYTLASPLLKEITLKSIQKELDKGIEPKAIVRQLKLKGFYFTLGQILTTIDDLTMLDIDNTKIVISEMTKLKEILHALGHLDLAEETIKIRDEIRKNKKFSEKLKEKTADLVQKIKVHI